MWRGNLTQIGSQPINVLGTIYNQIQAEVKKIDLTSGDVTVEFTLFRTAEEQNPGDKRTIVFGSAQYNRFGFSNNALLAAARPLLNLP